MWNDIYFIAVTMMHYGLYFVLYYNTVFFDCFQKIHYSCQWTLLQVSVIHLNVDDVQYQTQPLDNSNAFSQHDKPFVKCPYD